MENWIVEHRCRGEASRTEIGGWEKADVGQNKIIEVMKGLISNAATISVITIHSYQQLMRQRRDQNT